MDTQLWENVALFHGHKCPGLAIGYKAALLAKEILEIDNITKDEEIVCLSETDACGVDAIQIILKATLGTGSMRIKYLGKQAFNFYNRKNGKKVRLVFNAIPDSLNREEKMEYILQTPSKYLFTQKDTLEDFPKKARIHTTIICAFCNESVAQNAIFYHDNKPICKTCKGD